MPTARYWRIVGINTLGGDLALRELAFNDAAAMRLDSAATISASVAPVSGSLSSLNDASNATAVVFALADIYLPSFAIEYDFGSSVEVADVYPTASSVESAPVNFFLQYKNASDVWVTLYAYSIAFSGSPAEPEVPAADPHFSKVALYTFILGSGSQLQRKMVDPTIVGSGIFYNSTRNGGGFFGSTHVDLGTNGGMIFSAVADWPIASTYSGDYTIEAYARPAGGTATGTPRYVIGFVGGYSIRYTFVPSGGQATFYLFSPAGAQLASFLISGSLWAHLALVRSAGTVMWFVNGTQHYSAADSTAMTFTSIRAEGLDGEIAYDGIRLTENVARYTANFSRPTQVFPTQSVFKKATSTKTTQSQSLFTPPSVSIPVVEQVTTLDLMDGGQGSIYGTVKEDLTPTDLPLQRKVRLLNRGSNMVRETWSDATTGEFAFEGINEEERYTVVTYDHQHIYRAVITDNVAPEV